MTEQSVRTAAGLPLLVCHVAKRLKVCERTVRYWVEWGILPARRLHVKVLIFEEADVERLRLERERDNGKAA